MTKFAFIGDGSTVFAPNLLHDLFTFPELHEETIALLDIDPVAFALSISRVIAGLPSGCLISS